MIQEFETNHHFVDVQTHGPYALWHHLHTFERLPSGGTRLGDVVDYEPPFGLLGRLSHPLFVRRTVERIFDYRHKIIAEKFGTV